MPSYIYQHTMISSNKCNALYWQNNDPDKNDEGSSEPSASYIDGMAVGYSKMKKREYTTIVNKDWLAKKIRAKYKRNSSKVFNNTY